MIKADIKKVGKLEATIGGSHSMSSDISAKGYVQGPQGPQGPKGDPGYTPVKNVDYFDGKDGKDGKDYILTEADKDEIASIASDKIDLSAYATSEEVDSKVEAVRSDIPSRVSELTNDVPYTTQTTVNTMVTSAVQSMVQRMDAKDAEVKDYTNSQIGSVIDSFGQIADNLEADMISRDADVLAEAKRYADEHGGSVDSIDADKVHLLEPFNTDLQSGFAEAFRQVGVINEDIGTITDEVDAIGLDVFNIKSHSDSVDRKITDLYDTKADTADVATLVDNRVEEIIAKGANVTFIGNPVYNNGVLSGFSTTSYAEFPFMVDLRGKSFQIDFAITTGNDLTNQQNIIDSEFGFAIAIKNGKFIMAMSSNGSTWDYGQYDGTHQLYANRTYFVKVEYVKDVRLTLSFSTDQKTWTTDITRNGTTNLYPKPMLIGTGDIFGTPKPFGGSINLNYANLYVDTFLVWKGVADVSAQTRLAVNLSNIDEEGRGRIVQIVDENGFAKSSDLGSYATKSELSGYSRTDHTHDASSLGAVSQIGYVINPNTYISNSDGSLIRYNGWSSTEYVEVTEGSTIRISWSTSSSYNAWYGSEKRFISAFSANTVTDIKVPANAMYLRLSNNSGAMETLHIGVILPLTDTIKNDIVPTAFDALVTSKSLVDEVRLMTALSECQPADAVLNYGTEDRFTAQEVVGYMQQSTMRWRVVDIENLSLADLNRVDMANYRIVFANDKYRYYWSLIDNSWSMEEIPDIGAIENGTY